MDDVLRRLGRVEASVAATREDVRTIRALLPHLATRADINGTGGDTNSVHAEMNLLRADINGMEARLIRWFVGTAIATTSAAFAVAKFVH